MPVLMLDLLAVELVQALAARGIVAAGHAERASVAVHVSRLRAKLDRGFGWPKLLTDRHLGYRLATRPGQLAGAVAIV